MKKLEIIELLFLAFAILTFAWLYQEKTAAPLLVIMSVNLLAFFYMIVSFYQIFIGILKGISRTAVFRVIGYISIAVALVGVLFKVQVWPNAQIILGIGLFSLLGGLLLIGLLLAYKKQVSHGNLLNPELKSLLTRLIPYSLLVLFFFRVPVTDLYRTFGAFKSDPKALEILDYCSPSPAVCDSFTRYVSIKIQERYDHQRSPGND